MAWADMQEQQCCYLAGGGTSCGAWSRYYRVNVPIKDSYAVGCSVGQQNTNCGAQNLRCAYHT